MGLTLLHLELTHFTVYNLMKYLGECSVVHIEGIKNCITAACVLNCHRRSEINESLSGRWLNAMK
jgi:hypothetical protein